MDKSKSKFVFTVKTDDDAAKAYRMWPDLKKFGLKIGDELYEVTPMVPIAPKLLVVIRDEKDVFSCKL